MIDYIARERSFSPMLWAFDVCAGHDLCVFVACHLIDLISWSVQLLAIRCHVTEPNLLRFHFTGLLIQDEFTCEVHTIASQVKPGKTTNSNEFCARSASHSVISLFIEK